MITLENVTLIAMTGLGYKVPEHLNALEISQRGIKFGQVKLIQLGHITDIDSWSKAAIYDLPKYVDTEFCLLIHENGFIVNPEMWRDEWLNYDFIGAPFPLPSDPVSYRDEENELVRVGNSVGLRSKKLMDLIATKEWKPYFGYYHEDGFITCHHRKWLMSQGCKFAPLEEAVLFSREMEVPENQSIDKPFMFHINRVFPGRNIEYFNKYMKGDK